MSARDVIAEAVECKAIGTHPYDAADVILAALKDAGISLVEWKPMDTCPKAERVLTVTEHGIIEGMWDGEACGAYYWHDMEWYPYCWAPLPAPPKEMK